MKKTLLAVSIIVLAVFAVYVWPTRYIYSSERAGEYTRVVRIDRFSERVWVLTPDGWHERIDSGRYVVAQQPEAGPPTTLPADFFSKSQDSTVKQTQKTLDAGANVVSKPKPTSPKGWATVNDDTSVFKHCHFESGNQNVEGCDFVMAFGDQYPSAIVVLKKGERVALLSGAERSSGGKDIYKVKFQQWTGWMDAADLTPE